MLYLCLATVTIWIIPPSINLASALWHTQSENSKIGSHFILVVINVCLAVTRNFAVTTTNIKFYFLIFYIIIQPSWGKIKRKWLYSIITTHLFVVLVSSIGGSSLYIGWCNTTHWESVTSHKGPPLCPSSSISDQYLPSPWSTWPHWPPCDGGHPVSGGWSNLHCDSRAP